MKDPTEFRQRFAAWKNGDKVYEAGRKLPEVVVTADDPIKKLVEDVNARSNADFVNRVKDPNRAWIQDWEDKNKIATHKLSWAEDDGKAVVFPNVQNINGELHDFTDPKYNHGKWDALDSAIERGDTLLMTPEQAEMYTKNYKKYYPKGKTFDCGKSLTKYDVGTDDKTYLPEYEYEATVTPQGISLEKHKRITNKEDWLKYWGNVGAGYVNKALESVAKPILEGLKEATYFTPFAPLTSAIDTSVNLYNGNYLGAGLSALAGIPMARVLYNKTLPTIGRLTKPYTNYFASKALSNAIDDAVRNSLNGVKANAVREMFPTEDEFNFWHGGLDSDFDFKDLDVLRLGSKQAKKGRNYAGFYMYDSFDQPGAFRYGGGEAHGIKIADDAKIFNADFNTERLSVDELTGYLNLGYDLIKGRNVFGEPEYILLNRDAIKSTKFFENSPGHRINMRRPPRPKTNPKNLTNEELVLHWNRIVNDLSVDKKTPQSVIDLFDNADLPKTAKSGAEKFVLPDPNNPQYVFKRSRDILSPTFLKMKLDHNAILNDLQDLVLPTEYIGSLKVSGNRYVPYFRQLAIKSLDGKDAVLAGKEWPTIQRRGYEAFKNWLDIAKQNPKYSVEDGRVITEFGHIGDVGPQSNIGVDANGNPFAFDPMLFDGDAKKIFDYLYGPILYDKGKSIRINPANKGKFNATKKRTGKTTEQLAHSKNPLTRKRAVFALNSRKFKH